MPDDLEAAIAARSTSTPAGSDRALRSWPMPRHEPYERLIDARAKDPAALDDLPGTVRSELALYERGRRVQAEAFAWDSELELLLDQAADAEVAGELGVRLARYRDARANAERHGTLERARARANGRPIR